MPAQLNTEDRLFESLMIFTGSKAEAQEIWEGWESKTDEEIDAEIEADFLADNPDFIPDPVIMAHYG